MHKLMSRLKARRLFLGMTQLELAEAVGVGQAAVAHIESGRVTRPRNIVALAQALRVTVGWLADHNTVLPEEEIMIKLLKDAE